MTKVYIVNFDDGGIAMGFTSIDKAKAYLWSRYSEEVLPNLPADRAAEYVEEDAKTLDESGYIAGYGWIEDTVIAD